MRFWSRRAEPSRESAWASFAADLELEDGSELGGRLREHLDLGPGELRPIYTLSRPQQPRLVLFDQHRERSGPTGTVSLLRTCVLLRARPSQEFVSMRITARLSAVLEAIEAGRTGGSRLEFGGAGGDGAGVDEGVDEAFDRAVSVYTRDEAGARRLLRRPAREVLQRLVSGPVEDVAADDAIPDTVARTPVTPVVIIGSLDVLLILDDHEPVEFPRLTDLTADMMALYAALCAGDQARW